jgi:hypothetical protein
MYAHAGQRSWHPTVECELCSSKYVIEHRNQGFHVIRREDHDKARAISADKYQRERVFMQSAEVLQLKTDLAKYLGDIRTKAQVQREVTNAGFFIMSPSTFTRNYRGADDWVTHNITSAATIGLAMTLLGRSDNILEPALENLRRANAEVFQYKAVRILDVERR